MPKRGNNAQMPLFEGVDRIAVILYLLLVAAGMVCITSA